MAKTLKICGKKIPNDLQEGDNMRRFFRWLRNKINYPEAIGHSLGEQGRGLIGNSFTLTVYKAVGGMVVETNFYTRYHDNDVPPGMYIIHDDENLGESLSQIIMTETLKK